MLHHFFFVNRSENVPRDFSTKKCVLPTLAPLVETVSINLNRHHRRSIRLIGYDYTKAGLYFVTICCEGRKHRFGAIENGVMVLNEFGTVAHNEWLKLPERFSNFGLDVFQIMPNHMHGIIALNDGTGPARTVVQNIATEETVGAGFTPALNATDPNNIGQQAGFTPALNATDPNNIGQQAGFTPALKANDPNNIGQQPRFTPALKANDPNNIGQQPGFTPALNANDPNNIGQPPGFTPALNANDANNIGQQPGLPRRVNRVSTVGDIVGAYKSLVTNACIDICNSKNIRLGKLWQRNYYEQIIRNEQSYQNISQYIINNPTKWKDDKFYKE